ncbi:hypothetical protein EON67_04320 [archaeon]|nr:MAG: hypothetical protein EON67_04320 [archaeon]
MSSCVRCPPPHPSSPLCVLFTHARAPLPVCTYASRLHMPPQPPPRAEDAAGVQRSAFPDAAAAPPFAPPCTCNHRTYSVRVHTYRTRKPQSQAVVLRLAAWLQPPTFISSASVAHAPRPLP